MATLIMWWAWLQQTVDRTGERAGGVLGPFFWFWLAIIAIIVVFWIARFSSSRRRGPPPMQPR